MTVGLGGPQGISEGLPFPAYLTPQPQPGQGHFESCNPLTGTKVKPLLWQVDPQTCSTETGRQSTAVLPLGFSAAGMDRLREVPQEPTQQREKLDSPHWTADQPDQILGPRNRELHSVRYCVMLSKVGQCIKAGFLKP